MFSDFLRLTRTSILLALLLPASLVSQQTPSSQPVGDNAPASSASPAIAEARTPSSTPAKTESYSVLSAQDAGLTGVASLVTQKDVAPTYTRELVHVQWRGGDMIDLFVYMPKGVAKPPAILYLYSYPSDTSRFYDAGWAERATSNGFAAVGFVSALTGQRYHTRPMKEWFISELQESLGSTTHDVQMVLDYLAQRQDIDMSRIGMFGQGSGGTIAILAASVDPRIKALDVLDPWGDWPEWLKASPLVPENERANYTTDRFLKSIAVLDPVEYLPGLKQPALRVQQVEAGSNTPAPARARIAASIPGKVIDYADSDAHYKAAHAVGVSGWLKSMLAADRPTQQPALTAKQQ